MPPASIWQKKPCELVLLLRAGELNVRVVSTVTVSVFVIVSEGLAGIPRSQPEMNWLAIARTSLGSKGMSNGLEMAVASSKMFKMVPWRDSTVTMLAAALRTFGSWTRCAAPRYAPTPTCSTIRATVIMVETSVRAEEKSKVQPPGGFFPNEVRRDPRALTWVLSSIWMVVICWMATSADEKPALVKSDD